MNSLQNILFLLENYNALIKYHIKAHKECISDERKINFNSDNIPSIEDFQTNVWQTLHQENYSQDFVYLIYRFYLVCESNSDLFANHGSVEKQLNKLYPFANTLERLSFGKATIDFFAYRQINPIPDYCKLLEKTNRFVVLASR